MPMTPNQLQVAAVAMLAALACCEPAAADKAFGGEDAAYVDWAWKNCQLVSSKKEHDLVDTARGKASDAFQRSYEQQFYKIVAATPTPLEVRHTCEHVTEWYGPAGVRIEGLVAAKRDKPDVAGTSVGSPATSPSSGGKSGGRVGGGRGGGG